MAAMMTMMIDEYYDNDASDDGDDGGGKGVLLSSDLCFHFLAAEKIFVLKILSHFTFSLMMMMLMFMTMMKTMGLEAIQNFQTSNGEDGDAKCSLLHVTFIFSWLCPVAKDVQLKIRQT